MDGVRRLKPDLGADYKSIMQSDLIEISCVHTTAPSYIRKTIATQLHERELAKHSKYDEFARLVHKPLYAFIVSSYGVFSREAKQVIKTIADRSKQQGLTTSVNSFIRSLYNDILVALHRGNASILLSGEKLINNGR